MKQLFWKEWHELRLLPIAAAVCMFVLVIGAKIYGRGSGDPHLFLADDLLPLLGIVWIMFALVTGAALFAQEIGSGGLTFLSTLPISRGGIWWVKVAVGAAALLLSLLAIGLALILPVVILLPGATPDALWKAFNEPGDGLVNTLILLDVFAMSLAVSPFFDRPLSAIFAAAAASGVVYMAVGVAMSAYLLRHLHQFVPEINARHVLIPARLDFNHLVAITAALPLPVLLAVSYWTFTRGETLRSAKRFRVGAVAGLASLSVAGLVLETGHLARLW